MAKKKKLKKIYINAAQTDKAEQTETAQKLKLVRFKIKSDKYMSARGGSAEFFNIICGECGTDILLYQKDGPGNLFRMYLDRIAAPPEMADKAKSWNTKDAMQALICPTCNTLLAAPMVYEKENRLALRIVGPVHKKVNRQGKYLIPEEENNDGQENSRG